MRVYVTGSLIVESAGAVVLAMLAFEHRRPMSRDELAHELWPVRVPRWWETGLRAVVSKLRSALVAGGIPADDLVGTPWASAAERALALFDREHAVAPTPATLALLDEARAAG